MTKDLRVIIATDCGSTTTKAILIEKVDGGYRQTYRGEAPTTVEEPFNDVPRGVLNAIAEVEELSGRRLLEGERMIMPAEEKQGSDIYISTSSAGGGLQMLVAGAVKTMTAESAQRAALGAGAIVMDVLASNDGRLPHQKIERIRGLRPDMILLSGGTDGGTITHVVEMAEFVAAANPKPRLGHTFTLPIIYAGNKDAREKVGEVLTKNITLYVTDNLRPTLEQENLFPARQKIQELFMEHVMAQAPGYGKLRQWTPVPIMPTPAAVGSLIQIVSEQEGINVIGVDIGGATTDVFSVFEQKFNRTVSANLGLSYSVSNVLAEAGLENVMRWVPFDIDEEDVRNRIKNKMIRPTTIPQTLRELMIEQALAREALRLAFAQHKLLAVGLKGIQQVRSVADTFKQLETGQTLIKMQELDLLVGSGGVLSHAPRRVQAMAMLIDAFQPEWVTRLAVDSIFMMPHLGVLAGVHREAAMQVFKKDCLLHLGWCIAPTGQGKPGQKCMEVEITFPDRSPVRETIGYGEMRLYGVAEGKKATVEVVPARGFDVGSGRGRSRKFTLSGGLVGIVVDARGRPLSLATDVGTRRVQLMRWMEAMDLYARQEIEGVVSR
jgi:uncharacterized protein (TIGR01319 family)